MKFVAEYRDAASARALATAIRREATRQWTVMEVCGGQTHAIVKSGLDELVGDRIRLLHGPGCPVCVTPLDVIDRAQAIAALPGVTLCTFGDMMRVPGSHSDLFARRSAGADVRIVYSPLDALALARRLPDRQVVFLAVGFETTTPATAVAVSLAAKGGVANFSMLSAHVRTPPALTAILDAPGHEVQAFLGPGHVCTVMGAREYEPIAERYRVPIVIAGFEPLDILEGLLRAVRQLEAGRAEVELQYARSVRPEGNRRALTVVEDVFEVCDRRWRGIGTIPKSGLKLRYELRAHDAERRFDVDLAPVREPTACKSGEVLRGRLKPTECPAFGTSCTPDTPLGATMVSSEGACAAYFGRVGLVPAARLTARGAA